MNFVSNVNPRSYDGLVNPAGADPFKIKNQTALLEVAVNRLANRTMFEIDGWKRILASREIFQNLQLEIDNYQMNVKTIKSAQFQVKFINKINRNYDFELFRKLSTKVTVHVLLSRFSTIFSKKKVLAIRF